MTAPAIIWIALIMLALGNTLSKDGQPRTGKHSFGWSVVAATLHAGLLYWGRFFS